MMNSYWDALVGKARPQHTLPYQYHNGRPIKIAGTVTAASRKVLSKKSHSFVIPLALCYTGLKHPFPATHLISTMPLSYKSSNAPPSQLPVPTPAPETKPQRSPAMTAVDDTLKKTKQATQEERSQGAASQEVICPAARGSGHCALIVWHGGKDRELGVEVLPQVHDARDITAAVAVIRRRPDGHDRLVSEVPLPSSVSKEHRIRG